MSTPIPLRVALRNGGFEEPTVAGVEILPDASQTQAPKYVPGWLTTATDHRIELWRSGFNGVPAAEGSQFAELNANQESTLYQDLPTTPGTTVYWRLYHRGRLGQDTMALDIGAPGAVGAEQRRFTDGNTAWGFYTGSYTVPAGQTTTRFAFRSVAAAGGNESVGNFLDGVVFATAPLVVLTKTAIPQGPVEIGDVITYRITAKNEGGGAAENLSLTDAIPAGTTYVPGSLNIVDGPNAGPKTDQTGDDQGYFDADENRVVFHLGNAATAGQAGSLPNTETLPAGTTVEYRVRVDQASAGGQVANTATAAYENQLGPTPQPLTATSNETVTDVRPAADLSVIKSADDTTVTVGQTVTYRITVRNAGPNQATGVIVADQLPATLAFLSATATQGGYEPATGTWTVGNLPEGGTATLTLQAKATQAGPVTNTATVRGNETEPADGDNSNSITICVEATAPCDPCGPCEPPSGGCGPCPPIDPAPCNALTRTGQGLLVPRTDYTGLTGSRPPAIGAERSVDIDVRVDGNCPKNVTIGARLTPWAGRVGFPGTVNVNIINRPLRQWFDVPDTDLTLPEVGRYAIDLDARARIVADLPHFSNVRFRIFDVTAGVVVPDPDTRLWTTGIALTGPGLAGNEFALDNSAHLSTLYTIDGPRTLRIQAYREMRLGGNLTRPSATQIVGYTGLRAIKIND